MSVQNPEIRSSQWHETEKIRRSPHIEGQMTSIFVSFLLKNVRFSVPLCAVICLWFRFPHTLLQTVWESLLYTTIVLNTGTFFSIRSYDTNYPFIYVLHWLLKLSVATTFSHVGQCMYIISCTCTVFFSLFVLLCETLHAAVLARTSCKRGFEPQWELHGKIKVRFKR